MVKHLLCRNMGKSGIIVDSRIDDLAILHGPIVGMH